MNLELEQKFKVEMKAGKIDKACQRYDLGRNTMRRIAEAAGAVIRIGRIYLINFSKVDAYLDEISE